MLEKFTYLDTVKNLLKNPNRCLAVPEKSGIYVAVYLEDRMPKFKSSSEASQAWLDKKINATIDSLIFNWVNFSDKKDNIVYIGRANARSAKTNLRNRIRQFILFGQGKSITHYGGRYIWQIEDLENIAIYYKDDEKPAKAEIDLLTDFKRKHKGRLPFANLRSVRSINIKIIINSPTFLSGIISAPDSLHDPNHWERVESFGHKIAIVNGADKKVISLFAYLHDARRENDDHDPAHGERAVILLDELIEEGLITLSDTQYDQLSKALSVHNKDYAKSEDITVQTCWDADRLDLWRCGFIPNPDLMYTEYGKSKEMIEYAKKFSCKN